jgi:hypothetical protein
MYFLMPVVSCHWEEIFPLLPAPCSLLPFLFQIIADKFGELIFLAIVKSILIQF